jgi:hypothetical protein
MKNTRGLTYNYNNGQGFLVKLLCLTLKAALLSTSCLLYDAGLVSAQINQTYSKELSKYVVNGSVEYSKWKKKPEGLRNYLDSLANLSQHDYELLQPDEQKALWINAYNAFTIKLVLDHYPIFGTNHDFPADSFRQIPDAWEKMQFKVAGREVTLDEIEHTILRRDFHDPRTHFIIVCAARGGPQMLNHAVYAKDLERELEKAKVDFLNDPKNVTFDEKQGVLSVSKIFEWFPLDFACVEWFKKNRGKLPGEDSVIIEYLEKNSSPQMQKALKEAMAKNRNAASPVKVIFKSFDWSLNEKQ